MEGVIQCCSTGQCGQLLFFYILKHLNQFMNLRNEHNVSPLILKVSRYITRMSVLSPTDKKNILFSASSYQKAALLLT